ncbi:MAG: SurA N-terminal domain-containing protein [Gammaproteobacteria bacterium]|nr:SurA N-terminal domain-containing protein [Gammaproteobacteria bacterium]
MLQSIRDNAQGIVSKILVSLIAFTFVIWGAESLFSFSTGSDAPAAVNGQDISLQDLAQATEVQRRQVLMSNPDLDPVALDIQAIQANTLEQLIKEQILLQQAQQSGMAISAANVNQMIVDSKDFQVDGKFDSQLFQSLIANVGLTANVYKQTLEKNSLINQLQQGVAASAFTLPEQANLVAALDGQTRTFEVMVLPYAQQLAAIDVTTQQIEQYYQANSEQYLSPEQVQVDYVVLTKEQFKQQVQVSDQQIQDAYAEAELQHQSSEEREAAHILFNVDDRQSEAQALSLAEQAYTELQNGSSFASVAAEYSQDAGTSADGGSLGSVFAGDFGGEFDEALFGLEVGAYTKPVVTQFGVQIIRLEGLVNNTYPSLAEQEEYLRAELQLQGAENLFVAASETMADIAFSSPDLLELSEELALNIETSVFFDRNGATEFGDLAARVASAAFADDVFAQGNNSEVIEMASNKLLVLHLKDHKPAALQGLTDVSDAIAAQLSQEAAIKQLQATADTYVLQLQEGAEAASVASDAGLEWATYENSPRLNNAISPTLSQAVFKLARPAQGAIYSSSMDFTGDVSVIRLLEVTDANSEDLATEQRVSLTNALSRMQGQAELIAFEAVLGEKAEVERF